MIKKILLLFSFSQCFGLFAQENNFTAKERQQYFFDNAKTAMKNGELTRAIYLFSTSKRNTNDKKIIEVCTQKIDSLKLIVRANLTNEIVGNWRMFETRAEWAMREPTDSLVGKMITINPTQILFYQLFDKAKKWTLVKTEKLSFSDKSSMLEDPLLIPYDNKQVWSYWIDSQTGFLRAMYIGEENEEGIGEMVCGNLEYKYYKLE
jgi:hypothetical protein